MSEKIGGIGHWDFINDGVLPKLPRAIGLRELAFRFREVEMTSRLAPYGSLENSAAAAVGEKGKTPASLASRMPSPDIVAKVGSKNPVTRNLAARMPSAVVAAKVGISNAHEARTKQVVRRLPQA